MEYYKHDDDNHDGMMRLLIVVPRFMAMLILIVLAR